MKQRAVEILFKHKLQILLPLIIIMPLSIAITLRPKPQTWQTSAVVWVDQYRLLYQDERLGYTPGPSQAQLLNDFLRTRSFVESVVQQTQLAPLLDTPVTADRVIYHLQRSVRVFPNSNNFITVVVTMSDPDLAYEVNQALLVSFQEVLRTRLEAQSNVAASFYENTLRRAEEALTKSRRELAAYLAAHPELTQSGSGSALAAAQDPNLPRLTAQVRYDEQAYDTARSRYEQNQALTAAGLEGQQLAFTVVDEPQRPLNPVRHRRIGLLKLPLIGLVLGMMLSSGIATLLILTNRAVLGTYDVQTALGVPVLGEIPELRRRRLPWQRAHRDAVRLRLAGPARLSSPGPGRA